MTLDPARQFAQLLEQDKRYRLEAYVFVFEALSYAQTELGMGGGSRASDSSETEPADDPGDKAAKPSEDEQHLTGGQLCEAIRRFGLEQYGYMAKTVFNSWGVYKTGDFGEIVFNLIGIEQMRKTPDDRREDFEDVFDFDADLEHDFKIMLPE
jgi:uncharacterized repeat protein (TIGR04138 family)